MESLPPEHPPDLHVVLYQPEIAANAGAIGRTCVALGAMLWLVRPLGFLLTDRHRRRAGLDYWEQLRWRAVDDLEAVTSDRTVKRLWLYSTRASRCYTAVGYAAGDALVFGPESKGLPAPLLERLPERAVRIPMRPESRSLNLANAAAVAGYEARRQLGWPPSLD